MTRAWIAAILIPVSMAAQTKPPADPSTAITEARVRQRVDLIADDSMRGRDTPSPELDRTAAYVADEFRRAGLETTIQHYPLARRRLIVERSSVVLTGPDGVRITLPLTSGAAFMQGKVPAAPLTAPLVVLGGDIRPDQISADSLRGRAVVWLADLSPACAPRADGIGAAILQGHPAAVLFVPNETSVVAHLAQTQAAERLGFEEEGGLQLTLVAVQEAAVAAQAPALGRAWATLRTRHTTTLAAPEGFSVTIALADSVVGTAQAPNVYGILPGQDPVLAREYVVFSAHMDHLGVAHGAPGDSIYNGADDNASGTVGIIELAHAFTQAGVRPKRSLVFLTVSGEEKGLWGSAYFTKHAPIPVASMVADVNMDMIGRNWRDTVGVIGREHSNLGEILDWVASRHPELKMTPVGDRWPTEGRFYRSDHYNFARAGVPILFLSSGYSPDYHELTDSPNKVDAEKEARLLRLIFHFGFELADRPERPQWTPASYRSIVAGAQ
jgi:hypothetical protein